MSYEWRPTRLLMASESTYSAAKERFSDCFAKPSAGCFPIAKKQPALFTETRLILNTMMIIPLVQVLYYDGIVKTNMIGFG